MKKYDVCIVGLRPVEAATAVCLAKQDKRVIIMESDVSRLRALRAEQADFSEPGLDALLLEELENGFLTLSEELAGAVTDVSIVMIAIGTHASEQLCNGLLLTNN